MPTGIKVVITYTGTPTVFNGASFTVCVDAEPSSYWCQPGVAWAKGVNAVNTTPERIESPYFYPTKMLSVTATSEAPISMTVQFYDSNGNLLYSCQNLSGTSLSCVFNVASLYPDIASANTNIISVSVPPVKLSEIMSPSGPEGLVPVTITSPYTDLLQYVVSLANRYPQQPNLGLVYGYVTVCNQTYTFASGSIWNCSVSNNTASCDYIFVPGSLLPSCQSYPSQVDIYMGFIVCIPPGSVSSLPPTDATRCLIPRFILPVVNIPQTTTPTCPAVGYYGVISAQPVTSVWTVGQPLQIVLEMCSPSPPSQNIPIDVIATAFVCNKEFSFGDLGFLGTYPANQQYAKVTITIPPLLVPQMCSPGTYSGTLRLDLSVEDPRGVSGLTVEVPLTFVFPSTTTTTSIPTTTTKIVTSTWTTTYQTVPIITVTTSPTTTLTQTTTVMPTQTMTQTTTETTMPAPTTPPLAAAPTPTPVTPAPSSKAGIYVAIGAVAIIALAGLGYWLYTKRRGR